MSEHTDLLDSIAQSINTFRVGELPTPTPQHVDRWSRQFEQVDHMAFLRAFSFTVDASFVDVTVMKDFLAEIVIKKTIVGSDPRAFWLNTNFLNIQLHGESQRVMLQLFDQILHERLGISISQCGGPDGHYVYLDDIIFSGTRARTDLSAWISTVAPKNGILHIIALLTHTGGDWYLVQQLAQAVDKYQKDIKIRMHNEMQIENRKSERTSADVLWPTALPDDDQIRAYEAGLQYRFESRPRGGTTPFFESEAARQVLESAFLHAGMHIRALAENPSANLKPLGFGGFGLGFGSTLITYRNCPNNCPLALWWGNPQHSSGPLHWYPLLSRKI